MNFELIFSKFSKKFQFFFQFFSGHLEICKWLLSVDSLLLMNFELHWAASKGHLDVVKFFVSKGVDINVLSVGKKEACLRKI